MLKKLIVLALLTVKVFALPIGNPSDGTLFLDKKGSWEWGVGFYGDYVFNRYLETIGRRHVDFSKISTNAAYLCVRHWNTELYATLGGSSFSFDTNLDPFNAANADPLFDLETTTSFSWSVGGRASIWEYKCFTLGITGQYFWCDPAVKSVYIRKNVHAYPNTRKLYTEWQIATGIAWRYNPFFVPYIAVKYSRAFWHFNNQTFFLEDGNTATIPNLKSAKHVGYAVGLTLSPFMLKKTIVTVEGRFADEKAVFVNAKLYY